MTKIYVTKYALSNGIIETTTEEEDVTALNFVNAKIGYGVYVQMGKEAFLTREEAELRASTKAARRIDSLKRQIKKLQVLVAKPKWKR